MKELRICTVTKSNSKHLVHIILLWKLFVVSSPANRTIFYEKH